MSRRATTLAFLSLAAALSVVAVLVQAHSSLSNEHTESSGTIDRAAPAPSAHLRAQDAKNARNLGLQPEAIKLLRRIGGNRFRSKTPPTVIMQGVLTTGPDREDIQISRYQNARGERVELVSSRGTRLLSWDASAGARNSRGTLGLTDRTILERVIFDSVDQFILAQMRGASYQIVVRNLRPDDAPDNYDGPLWDVVRVDDPESDEQKRPMSRWRLYHLNRTTGLIDKIVSDSEGQRIEANLSDWKERDGESFPSTITWTSNGQPLMTLNVINVSFVAQP